MFELDFRAVKFLFFPRWDLNSHHWYTAAPFAYPYVQRPRPLDHIHIYIYMYQHTDFIWLFNIHKKCIYIYMTSILLYLKIKEYLCYQHILWITSKILLFLIQHGMALLSWLSSLWLRIVAIPFYKQDATRC